MRINHKMDKSFGLHVSVSGWIFLIIGLFFIKQWVGIILFIFGFVLAFFTDGVIFNPGQRKIKRYSGLFGIPLIGRWESMETFTGILVLRQTTKYSVWSRSNRHFSDVRPDYRLFLAGPDSRPQYAVMKCSTAEEAEKKADRLSALLRIPVLKPDHR